MFSNGRAIETYRHLTDVAAFFDKIGISVWGTRRRVETNSSIEEANLPIGGFARFYARCCRRHSAATGNKLQFAYGPLRPRRNQSPFKFTFWAGRRHVLCADAFLCLDGIMRQGYRARVSAVELAFDIECIPLDQFTEELCTRAKLRDVKGTLYVAGVNSAWQAKFYRRTDAIGRIEFTFTSVFLKEHGIQKIHELYLLRNVRLFELVSFCRVDQSHGEALPPRAKKAWEWLQRGLPPRLPASLVLNGLREMRIEPRRWIIPSDGQRLLRTMQRNLVF